MTRTRVAIIFGGRSSEHAISCATAAGVLAAIDRELFDVVPIGIARDGSWVLVPDDPAPLQIAGSQLPEVSTAGVPGVLVPFGPTARQLVTTNVGGGVEALAEVDVVLPLLHGPFGEDGTIQGLLELGGIPYVGSGVLASSAGMDKHAMKVLLAGAGVPIGPYAVITRAEWERDPDLCLDAAQALGDVLFVKPARAGSSVGISRVARADDDDAANAAGDADSADDDDDAAATGRAGFREELRRAIEEARTHDPKVVVEAALPGREIEVAVLEGRGTDRPRTTAPGEIIVGGGRAFYDFEAKYTDTGDTDLVIPARLTAPEVAAARALAADAFDALGCEGLARVDFFLTGAGFVVNEVNTMPGFTPFSMFPQLWLAQGVTYPELITELIELALARPVGLR